MISIHLLSLYVVHGLGIVPPPPEFAEFAPERTNSKQLTLSEITCPKVRLRMIR